MQIMSTSRPTIYHARPQESVQKNRTEQIKETLVVWCFSPTAPWLMSFDTSHLNGICGVEVWQIGNDGGFLEAPVDLTTCAGNRLLLGPAERADILVDFTNVPLGAHLPAGTNVDIACSLPRFWIPEERLHFEDARDRLTQRQVLSDIFPEFSDATATEIL